MADSQQRTATRSGLRNPDITQARLPEHKGQRSDAARHAYRRRLYRWSLLIAAVLALTAFYSVFKQHVMGGTSDETTPILQAQSMLHGDPLLGGWRLKLESFWLEDDLFYAIGILLFGVSPVLYHIVPALIAALLVCLAAALSRTPGSKAARVSSIATVVVLLGLPGGVWGTVLLQSAWGIGSILWCLAAFALLRSARWGSSWILAVVLLSAGLLSDFKVLVYGVAPVLGAALVAMVRARRLRAGLPSASAALAALALFFGGRWVLAMAGGWDVGTANPHATVSVLLHNIANIPGYASQVFGVGNGDWGLYGVSRGLNAVHIVGLLLVVVAAMRAAATLVLGSIRGTGGAYVRTSRESWLGDALVIGIIADLTFFCYAKLFDGASWLHYLAATVVYGVILAGRLVGELVEARATAPDRQGRSARQVIAMFTALVVAAYVASSAAVLAAPVQQRPIALVKFLESKGLLSGLGAYWEATSTTVAASDRVRVRPVTSDPEGGLARWGRQSTASWYAGKTFRFLLYTPGLVWQGVDDASAVKQFGPFDHAYDIGPYRVLAWDHPLTMSPVPSGN